MSKLLVWDVSLGVRYKHVQVHGNTSTTLEADNLVVSLKTLHETKCGDIK